MNKEDSRLLILQEWDRWAKRSGAPAYEEMQRFYVWLEGQRPELLQWKIGHGRDRWQDVHAWLNAHTGYGQ
jgi:hypothetical protein